MELYISAGALTSSNGRLLAKGALSALKRLEDTGILLHTSTESLSDFQKELIDNEHIELVHAPLPDENSGSLVRFHEGTYEFLTDGKLNEQAESWSGLAQAILYPSRKSVLKRDTEETKISVGLNLDGTGQSEISTGLNFFDHMLNQISRHGLIDLKLICDGDLQIDEHHTIEDTAIALGSAIRQAISDNKAGIQRYGFVLPMDEARAQVAIDLSDRPYLRWEVDFKREYVGDFPTEMAEHFFYTLAMNAKATLHISAVGTNEHHIIESIFKGFAKALRFAVSRNERIKGILPTTKGII